MRAIAPKNPLKSASSEARDLLPPPILKGQSRAIVVLAAELPATVLLGLESRLKHVRTMYDVHILSEY